MVEVGNLRWVRLSGRGGSRLWTLLALAVASLIWLIPAAKADAACASATDCANAATWQNAVADSFHNQGLFFQGVAQTDFVNAKQWYDKATYAYYAGDANAAAWYKAIADDYAHKAAANSTAANQRFAAEASTRAAAEDSLNRARFFAAVNDVGSTYPEGTNVPVADASAGHKYNCTGAAKQVTNKRKIESSWFHTDLFWYRIETPWEFCNGKITKLYPATPDQDIYKAGDDAKWKFDRREKVRANCYGPTGSRSDPERCAWTYRFYFVEDLPTVHKGGVDIDLDKHRSVCVTTQVKGNGAHYRHGGCDLKAWSGSSWGGGEY